MIDRLCQIVKAVGNAVAERRFSYTQGGRWQGDQLKTLADELSHRMLSEYLRVLFDVPVVSEEDAASLRLDRPAIYWLIDPIDGTRSLAEGFPGWVIQAALIVHNVPTLAAIYAPDLEQLFAARREAGAWCNGVSLYVDRSPNGRSILVDNYPQPRGAAADAMAAIPCSGYLESGSIALKICRIADGTADLFFKNVIVRDWDVAAPMLILREAGGFFGLPNGQQFQVTGNYEKNGLIATRSKFLFERTVNFLDHQNDFV